MLTRCGGESLWENVIPQINHLEPGALEHHSHQVLADSMEVATNSADHDLPSRLHAAFR